MQLPDDAVGHHHVPRGEAGGQGIDEFQRLRHRQGAEIHDGEPADGDGKGLLFEPFAAAVRAGVLAHVLLVLLAHGLALRLAVAALHAVHQPLEGLAQRARAAGRLVLQLQRLAARAVHEHVHHLLRQFADGGAELEAVFFRQGVVVHLGDAVALDVPPAGGLDAALKDGEGGVGDDELGVGPQLGAEPGAGGAGAVGAVEGEHARGQLLDGDAAVLAGVVLRKKLLLPGGDVVHQHQPAGEAGGGLRAVRQAAGAVRPHHQAVHDDLDVVLFVLVELDVLREVIDAAVHPHAHIAGLARVLEHLCVLALARAHDGGEDLYARALRPGEHLVDDLVDGLLAYLPAALGAVGHARARPEQAQIVVYLRHRADGGAGVAAGRFLVDGYGGGEALDVVHVGLVHLPEEHPRVAGKALDIAPLALGVYGVERERALAAAGEAGEHDELVARYLQVDVFEVVLPRALDENAVSHNLPRYS